MYGNKKRANLKSFTKAAVASAPRTLDLLNDDAHATRTPPSDENDSLLANSTFSTRSDAAACAGERDAPPPTCFEHLCGRALEHMPRTVTFDGEHVAPASSASASFPPNIVRNQQYSILSFVPVVLFNQFKFFFNLYFLLVALTQFIPVLQVGFLVTYIAPLVRRVSWSPVVGVGAADSAQF